MKENINLSNHLIGDELFQLLIHLKEKITDGSSNKKEGLLQLIRGYFNFGGLSENPNLFSINFLGDILNNNSGDGKDIIKTQLLIIGSLLDKLNLKECEQEYSQDSSVFEKRVFQFSQLFTQPESPNVFSREPFDSPRKRKLRDILDILVNYDKLGRNDMDDRKKILCLTQPLVQASVPSQDGRREEKPDDGKSVTEQSTSQKEPTNTDNFKEPICGIHPFNFHFGHF